MNMEREVSYGELVTLQNEFDKQLAKSGYKLHDKEYLDEAYNDFVQQYMNGEDNPQIQLLYPNRMSKTSLVFLDEEDKHFDYEKVKKVIINCIKYQDKHDITMGEITNRCIANGLTLDEYWEIYEYLEHWGYPEYRGSLKDWSAYEELDKTDPKVIENIIGKLFA